MLSYLDWLDTYAVELTPCLCDHLCIILTCCRHIFPMLCVPVTFASVRATQAMANGPKT